MKVAGNEKRKKLHGFSFSIKHSKFWSISLDAEECWINEQLFIDRPSGDAKNFSK